MHVFIQKTVERLPENHYHQMLVIQVNRLHLVFIQFHHWDCNKYLACNLSVGVGNALCMVSLLEKPAPIPKLIHFLS